MTDLPTPRPTPGPARTDADRRRRNTWSLLVIGLIGATAAALLIFVLGTNGKHHPVAGPTFRLTEVPGSRTAAPSTHAASHSASTSHHRSTSASASTPARTRTSSTVTTSSPPTSPPPSTSSQPASSYPCPTAEPCSVSGRGGVQSALNEYRAGHGQATTPVLETNAAQQCAVTRGDGPQCAQPFAVVPEPSQNGRLAITDIASGQGNWLLDPQLSSVEVGWAYHPATAQYVCVLIEHR